MKAFSLLGRQVRTALSQRGFKRPTDIQEAAIPIILQGRDCLVIAPTGIGKTESAVLPVFDRFLAEPAPGISIIYVTPLRALNRDLMDRLTWWSEKLGIKVAVRHGDTTAHHRRKQALSPPDMLITTPETIQAILTGKVLRRHLANVRYVIVDEIHELAEDKRGAQLSVGLERLQEVAKKRFQRIGLSATIGSVDEVCRFLSRDAEVVKVSPVKDVTLVTERPKPTKEDRRVAELIISSLNAATRLRRMRDLIRSHRSTMVFVNTREMAEVLASRFHIMGEKVGIHHSSLAQEARIAAEDEFKKGEVSALVCTSSLELGIDVGSIDLVVQYKSPRQVTRLLQRIGRSGHRVGERSKGIILATDSDDIVESLVITRRALGEELEKLSLPDQPLDVLAHQIVGLIMDSGKVDKSRAYSIITRSPVFKGLSMEEFEDVLGLLKDLRLVWLDDDGTLGKRRGTLNYYFQNLSTIPDQRNFKVANIASQKGIGVLDEAFVANYVEPGNLIIFKGRPWNIVSVDEDEILVEPVDEISGAVPSWVGEEIPVPFDVAQEVGYIRRRYKEEGASSLDPYPGDAYTKRLGLSTLRRHLQKGIPLADDRMVVAEVLDNLLVIHACFGMKVNQTLGRFYSILLTSWLGHSVTLSTDAYRIILQSGSRMDPAKVKELFQVDFDLLEPLMSKSLARTSLFRYKFVHVAKRFGALARDQSYRSTALMKVIRSYEGSPIYRETLKEIFRDSMDMANTKVVMDAMKRGDIELDFVYPRYPSPLAELGLSSYAEVVLPERAEKMILRAMEKRIGRRRVELFCLYCADWAGSYRIASIEDDFHCENCGARQIAVLKGKDNRKEKGIYKRYRKKEKVSAEEKKTVKQMQLSSNLLLSYGRKAIITQGARGVGPENAKRILVKTCQDEDLYRNILKQEKNYARTKRFWD